MSNILQAISNIKLPEGSNVDQGPGFAAGFEEAKRLITEVVTTLLEGVAAEVKALDEKIKVLTENNSDVAMLRMQHILGVLAPRYDVALPLHARPIRHPAFEGWSEGVTLDRFERKHDGYLVEVSGQVGDDWEEESIILPNAWFEESSWVDVQVMIHFFIASAWEKARAK
jgi:hypothetical protein